MEGMKDQINKELDSFKDGIHAIKGGILDEIIFLYTLNSSTQEEDKENINVVS